MLSKAQREEVTEEVEASYQAHLRTCWPPEFANEHAKVRSLLRGALELYHVGMVIEADSLVDQAEDICVAFDSSNRVEY